MAVNWGSLIGIALWALIPGFIAKKKGRSFAAYFFLSFLITPLITMIVTLCVKNLNEQSSEASSQEQTQAIDTEEKKWLCKCGSKNAESLSYCPMCKRTRSEGEVVSEGTVD